MLLHLAAAAFAFARAEKGYSCRVCEGKASSRLWLAVLEDGRSRDYKIEAKGGSQLRIIAGAEAGTPHGSAIWLHLPRNGVGRWLNEQGGGGVK